MQIKDFYQRKQRTFSFEFFPPKTPEAEEKLFETITGLKDLNPAFVSVTYGAMGTTRENTLRLVSKIKNVIGIEVAMHLTCVGHTQKEIEDILLALRRENIENIVALRGDPPKGETSFKPVPNGFRYASELVGFVRKHPKFGKAFSLAVAGYPEGHMECRDLQKDLEHLKVKVDAGADAVITQLFFDNRDFFQFLERTKKIGIKIPVIPGIMPVTHGAQIQKFAQMCGARIPEAMQKAIERLGDNQPAVEAFGIDYATKQCDELLRSGVPGLHFYTLNKSNATRQIYSNLGFVQKF